jgi:hypothetical protein
MIDGEFPPLHKIKAGQEDWGEWRSDGGQTIVYGMHPSGVAYSYPNQGSSVVKIKFDEINKEFKEWRDDDEPF